MREAVRSQLRKALVVWAVAGLTWIVGACAAIAIFVYGLLQVPKAIASDAILISIGPMVLGTALVLVLTVLFIGVRDRFEERCWKMIEADPSTSIGGEAEDVLVGQAGGRDDRTAAVRTRRSGRFRKRLGMLIEYAWPPMR